MRFMTWARFGLAMALSSLALAQSPPADKDIRSDTKTLSGEEAKARISKLRTAMKEVRQLEDFLRSKGFAAENNYIGFENVVEGTKDRKGFRSWFLAQDYSPKMAKEVAVLAITHCEASDHKEPYVFAIIYPRTDFDKGTEYHVMGGKVIEAKSWRKCLKKHAGDCNNDCLLAIATCAPGAAGGIAYFACVATSCGSCFGRKVIGCCACDCGLLCRWATGCCNR